MSDSIVFAKAHGDQLGERVPPMYLPSLMNRQCQIKTDRDLMNRTTIRFMICLQCSCYVLTFCLS